MIKKIFFIFILLTNIFFVYSGSNCDFETNTCQRTSDSFNTFNLNFENSTLLDSFDAEIYSKQNPSNKIKIEINQTAKTFVNLNPFIDPGVYILKIEAISKSGSKKISNYEFIFDNLEPMPPIIPLNLIGNNLVGKTQFANTKVLVEDKEGNNLFTGTSDENGSVQINLNLPNKINYVKFYTKNSNAIKSAPVERIIFKNKINGNIWTVITSISIDNLSLINARTVNKITSKRNFYVSGISDSKEGGIIYVNGIKTLTDSNGNFGQFILLNEGLNKIIVKNLDDSISNSTQITYLNPRFQFREFTTKKVIGEDNLKINVKTNYELPFNIYLNGQFYREVISSKDGLDFSISGFNPGKNYVYLEGLNNQRISKIVYYDIEKPKINLMMPLNISKIENFIFEIKDDVSINLSSIRVDFGNNQIYSGEQIERIGDFYKIDIEDLENEVYNFIISVSDLSGKFTSLSGSLNIADSNTFIKDIFTENGDFVGNRLFLDSTKTEIILTPSRYIAFKSIYLDGQRHIDYEMNEQGEITIKNLVDLKSEGILKLNFINNNYVEFSQIYYYFSDAEKPTVKLDYIENSKSSGNKTIRITGEILDSHFDWTTLRFNSQNDFVRYGKYFEVYVKAENGNFEIDGLDYSKNQIQNGEFGGGLLYNDNSYEKIQAQENSNNLSFNSVFIDSNSRTKKYLSSYDGFDLNRVYLSANNFALPVAQRNGLRSINLKGIESSQLKFSNYDKFSIDSIEPKIYFVNKNGKKKIIFDGTLSAINRESIDISIDGVNLDSKNYCQDSLSIFSDCIQISNFNDKLIVSVSDVAGNRINQIFSNSDIVDFSSLNIILPKAPQIYFSGNDKIINTKNYFIQGQIRSFNNKIKSVKQAGNSCAFDDFNFVCQVELEVGENNLEIKVIDSNNQIGIANWNIDFIDTSGFNTQIFEISAKSIYKSGRDYYIIYPNALMNGSVSNTSLIKLIINGEEILAGNKNRGIFNIPLDFSEQINDKDEERINILIEAEDELGNTAKSNSILVIFNRVIKTLVNIFID